MLAEVTFGGMRHESMGLTVCFGDNGFSGGPPPASPPVDCKHASGTVETTICQAPALKARDSAIAATYNRVLSHYRGADRATFSTGQALWHISVNNCQNSPDQKSIKSCVETQFTEREILLTTLEANPAKLATSVANYTFVHPDYLLKFAQQYDGKTVNVSGAITIEACNTNKKASLKGSLDHLLEVRFKSLPDDTINFLCDQTPFSWWSGTIRLDNGHPYLYATDVLGEKLP